MEGPIGESRSRRAETAVGRRDEWGSAPLIGSNVERPVGRDAHATRLRRIPREKLTRHGSGLDGGVVEWRVEPGRARIRVKMKTGAGISIIGIAAIDVVSIEPFVVAPRSNRYLQKAVVSGRNHKGGDAPVRV